MKEERKKYEIPSMERNLVELEDGFCVASADVQNGPKQAGINAHEVNGDFEIDFTSDSNADKWD